MPIPGSRAGLLIDPGMIGQMSKEFPSVATFYAYTSATSTGGQSKKTFVQMNSAHTNVKARRAPIIRIRPEDQVKEGPVIVTDARFHLVVWAYFADIFQDYRVSVDGQMHRIVGVEWDGNSVMSRFLLSDVIPFNP